MGPPPECGFVSDQTRCRERGDHFCEARAEHFAGFCREVLVHTKGSHARQAFRLRPWQRDITDPVFGEVEWSATWNRYVRRYRLVWLEIARKNGKSELAAAIVLYLLVADGEESAEVYGAAKTTKQAGKVGEVVRRMMQLSPVLRQRLRYSVRERKVWDDQTHSYYEVIPADADVELGHNPSGIVIDEFLAQADGDLYEALRTGMGARAQPIMLMITTAGKQSNTFAKDVHDEMRRVAEDPARSPHTFVRIFATPEGFDPFDEEGWYHASPALGDFLSVDVYRQEAIDARNDPKRLNGFRQFRLNQWVSNVTRWISLDTWNAAAGPHLLSTLEGQLADRACWAGLDLSSTTDLSAWVLVFPDSEGGWDVVWRFYTPESQVEHLDQITAGNASQWAREGFLTVTEGDWIDYGVIHRDIAADHQRFRIVTVGYDQREATATAQHMLELGLNVRAVTQGFWLSESLKFVERGIDDGSLRHGGHPVARWNADGAEVKTNDAGLVKLVKPARRSTAVRVDGIAALTDAVDVGIADGWEAPQPKRRHVAVY